jgi:DNA repair ATPase RecN
MIKSAKIKNFESWKDAEIEFHPGINVIIGESDEGKSGLIRALKFNTLNRPKGFPFRSDFVSDNKQMTSVEITYDSEDTVLRQRNLSGTNEYRINNGEPFVALRTDVPDEVFKISKISSINIQGQHPSEQYFLLTEKPGYVAKEFNKVSDLVIMDKAMAEANSRIRSAKSTLDVYQKELKEKETSLKENEWAIEAKEKTEEIKNLNNQIQKIEEKQAELDNLIQSLADNKKKLVKYKYVKKAQKDLLNLSIARNKFIHCENQIESLNTAINHIKKVTFELKAMSDISNALKDLKTLKNSKGEFNQIDKEDQELGKVLTKIETLDLQIDKTKLEFDESLVLFNEIREKEACPTCGRNN